ncbi:DoxX family protein [Candidatus Parcubacteria bacterium]|nr:DoxX family protein [Candidatus Parcubacteria bacterium]
MNNSTKTVLALLRIALGALFLYAGLSKVLTPGWSAAGYLAGAKTLPGLYHWLSSSSNIGWVNLLNEWGPILVGLSLISGVLVRWAAIGGVLIMALYYIPILDFPHVGASSFIVDQHVIFSLVLLIFFFQGAGKWNAGKLFRR